jgi:hypothetical protein
VSLPLELPASGAATGLVIINIETVTDDGLPSGTRVGHGSIRVEKISTTAGWVDVDIAGAFVTAGARYVILPSTSDGVVSWYMDIGGDVKPYPSGYWVSEAGGAWHTILTNQDWTFATYVAPDTIDQDQSETSGTGGGARALVTTPVGQTFTVGLYGLLDRVSAYLTNSSATPAPITVTILRVGSNGLPLSGTQVSTGTIPAAAIPQPSARSWASASISPFIVKVGERYAILLSTSGSGIQWVLVVGVYSGGTQVIRNGTSWASTSSGFAFQTCLLEPIIDQAQTAYPWGIYFGDGHLLCQSFTAHVTGLLTQVSVMLDRTAYYDGPAPSADVTVGIYTVPSETMLDRRLLGSGSTPLSWIPRHDNPGWLSASFSGVNVTAGTQYSIALDEPSEGFLEWVLSPDVYPGGNGLVGSASSWQDLKGADMTFKTYVLPIPEVSTMSPYGIKPCSNGVCPAAVGGFNPAGLTDGVKSQFQFQERQNGTGQSILNFSDPRLDGINLRGCTTESAACALTVRTLACSNAQSMLIGGTFTPRGEDTTSYRLKLTVAMDGSETLSLTAGGYAYTMTFNRIFNLTCPQIGGQ